MALNGYFGQPGSGKSYSVVEYVIIPALKRGRHVVTNIPLEVELLTQVYGGSITQLPLDVLDREQLADLLPHGCVAIIDEVWRRWPSGQKVHRASKEDLQLLKEHRHRVDGEGNAMQVVLVSQAAADLAMWVRQLIAHSFHMDKLDTVGLDSKFSIKVYKGCPVGDRIPAKLLVRDAIGTYRPEVYQYYRSATQSQASDLSVGDEKAIDRRANVWSSWQIKALLIMVPLMIAGGIYLLSYYFGMADRAAAKQAKRDGHVQQPFAAPELPPIPSHLPGAVQPNLADSTSQSPAPAPAPAPSGPALSGYWRVVGYVKRRDQAVPENPAAWRSVEGYGDPSPNAGSVSERWLGDFVVVKSWGGMRNIPASQCKQMDASRDYSCIVDGELVTPWSGQQGSSEVVGGRPIEAAKSVGSQPVERVKSLGPNASATSGAT